MPKSRVFLPTCLLILLGVATAPRLVRADDEQVDPPASAPSRTIGSLAWHTDYAAAYRQARDEKKLLFVFFRDDAERVPAETFERDVLAAESLSKPLAKYVRAVLPLDAPVPTAMMAEMAETADDAKATDEPLVSPKKLVEHHCFDHLHRRQGIVVLDFTDKDAPFYANAVSAHPFDRGRYYPVQNVQTLLDLPRGTITQRTLTYALRMHPERPRSVWGKPNEYLYSQANRHSAMMAQWGGVGHLDWGNRYAQMTAAFNGRVGVSEVAAMGFGGNLVEAAFSCVQTWRSSPTHWGMMSAQTSVFGYDMVRAANGNWFATGILGSGW